MMQLSDGACFQWQKFLEFTKDANPLDYGKISQYVKIKLTKFPTDNSLIDYYENVFSNVTNSKNRKKWHQMDKYLLIWCVAKLLQVQQRTNLVPNEKDWEVLTELLQVDCQLLKLKWISLLHSNLRIHQWTREEDQILKDIAQKFYVKNNWTELTIMFNSHSKTQRYPKQIRERWKNVLNPSIQKCLWDQKEKMQLIQLVHKYGKRWALIQHHIKGRSENQIKNQYNGIMRNIKKEKLSKEEETNLLLHIIQNPNENVQNLIDQYLNEIRTTKMVQQAQPTQEELKVEVKQNFINNDKSLNFEHVLETNQKLEFQSPQTLQNSIQNFPQNNHYYQYSPYEYQYNSMGQQQLLSHQQQFQVQNYISYRPSIYQQNYAHIRFPYYM